MVITREYAVISIQISYFTYIPGICGLLLVGIIFLLPLGLPVVWINRECVVLCVHLVLCLHMVKCCAYILDSNLSAAELLYCIGMMKRDRTFKWTGRSSESESCAAVLLFFNISINQIFLGYFDPEKTFLDK